MPIRTVIYPALRLREVSHVVDESCAIHGLMADMAETMYAEKGLGLAAIQLGQPLRLFILDPRIAGGDEKDPPLVFVNPELVRVSRGRETAGEGCLSFPGVVLPITRSFRATIRATDAEGVPFEQEGEGLLARAFQHEMDHLEARLIVDHVGRIKRQLVRKRLASTSNQPGQMDRVGR